ncbi:MAG: OmpA family protein [Desulfobacteraceae bacterium]|nr:OmpA family protein [Desulfobacteraceae bacterium]
MKRHAMVLILATVLGLALWIPNTWAASNRAAVIEGEPLVLHFTKGQMTVTDADKARIKQMLEDFKLTIGAKMLVVGHTDSSGDERDNLKLSYERAQAVRRHLISIIGGKIGKDILAIGRGAENPVADNTSQAGRAQNRRVEIYLAQVVSGNMTGKNRQIDPNKAVVEKMVQEARLMLRRKQMPEALQLLHQAHAQGGDRISSWHAVMGIAGYYSGTDLEKVRMHLTSALNLDPFNQEAHDYMGRVVARQKVAAGAVSAQMGLSLSDPISVHVDAQTYEYLRLFGVRPVSRDPMTPGGLDVWHCRTSQGESVTYYFDRSGIYEQLYDLSSTGAPTPDQSMSTADGSSPVSTEDAKDHRPRQQSRSTKR